MIEQPYLFGHHNCMLYRCGRDGDSSMNSGTRTWSNISPISKTPTLACQLRREFPAQKMIEIDPSTFEGTLRFVDLPLRVDPQHASASLPRLISQLWKAVGKAKIVHSGPGGWPISFAWFAIPMAKLRGKFALTIVESASWRPGSTAALGASPLIQAMIYEPFCRILVNISDMAIFTHSGYRREMLMASRQHRGHVISASWIDPQNILDRAEAEAIWAAKLADPDRPLKAVFASTLNVNKGIPVLLDALKELEASRGVLLSIDIYGKRGRSWAAASRPPSP